LILLRNRNFSEYPTRDLSSSETLSFANAGLFIWIYGTSAGPQSKSNSLMVSGVDLQVKKCEARLTGELEPLEKNTSYGVLTKIVVDSRR
jgi:hypothetical protein